MTNKRLKVIIVNDFGNINGGAAKIAVDTTVGLSREDIDVHYFCASGKINDALLSSERIHIQHLNQEVLLEATNKFKAIFQGLWNKGSEQAMFDLLKDFDPEKTIVHVHGWTKSLSVSCISAALQSGFKVVITLHDFFIYCPNGSFYNYPDKHICHKTPLSVGCITSNCDSRSYFYKMFRVNRSLIERNVFRKFKNKVNFIALSRLSYDVLKPYISKFKSTCFIENPIDVVKKPRVNILKNSKIIYVGRVSVEKGISYFCRAIESLNLTEALVVGEGPELNKLTNEHPTINFMGWQSKEQINKILEDVRVLVFPSVLYETYGLVVQEAASCGIPIIISDCTSAREIVTDGDNGLIFKSKNVPDLADKIKRIYSDDDLAERLSKNAYDTFWSKDHTLKRYSLSLIDYYHQILA
ncbi:glycosyltransferase family 4 protein [Mucilaginibacter sp. AW1-3]